MSSPLRQQAQDVPVFDVQPCADVCTESSSRSSSSSSNSSSSSTSSDNTSASNTSGERTSADDKSSNTPTGNKNVPTKDKAGDSSSIVKPSSSGQLYDDFDKTFSRLGAAACAQIRNPAEISFSEFSKAISQNSCNVVAEALKMMNALCHLYEEHKNIPAGQRMEFIDHSHAPLLHHPGRSTAPQPQLIAVLSSVARSWRRDPGSSIAWHHVAATAYIRLEENDEPLLKDCELSLSALTQARPDLPGCLSMAFLRSGFKLLWSDPTTLLKSENSEWSQPCMVVYALSFIHFLYTPFACDPTISLDAASSSYNDLHSQRPIWLIKDDVHGTYRSKTVLSVGEAPSQNWVISTSEYRAPGASEFSPCPRTVIKDTWPSLQDDPTFEGAILRHIHRDGDVPGVCRLFSTFAIPIDVSGKANAVLSRRKYRVIMDGTGQDIYSCASVLEFLMIMYDVLEVLKHLHETHDVLHRDISPGNILRRAATNAKPNRSSLKFAADIVATRYPDVSAGPRCTLIDFDNAFWHHHTPDSSLSVTVGTPSYVARSITSGFRIRNTAPTPPFISLVGSALECYVNSCGEQTYNDISAIDIRPKALWERKMRKDRAHFSPHHDAESCFWVIMKFMITALPAVSDPRTGLSLDAEELCRRFEMQDFGNIYDHRGSFFDLDEEEWAPVLSGELQQFGPLMHALARAVHPIYEYCDPITDPYHLHHALQRLLLQEICRVLDNRSDVTLKARARRVPPSSFTPPAPVPDAQNSPRSSRKRSREDSDCSDISSPSPSYSPLHCHLARRRRLS